ncbi:MAG: hypothetical protein JSW67_12280 [Candidatus Latescibacterota bacterium]|nr:MAG: hypothetical protein JSW67_12280 [Candidatus Latescibacterota bacterium]
MQTARVMAAALMAVGALAVPLHAHEYHVSIAEVEWNAESTSLEVALRVKPEDLEEALARRHDMQRINLDRTPGVDSLITLYLQERFEAVERSGERAQPAWLGKEVTPRAAWLYFEFPLAQTAAGVTLRNRVFFETAAKQVNTVNLRIGEERATLTFTREAPEHEIDFDAGAPGAGRSEATEPDSSAP